MKRHCSNWKSIHVSVICMLCKSMPNSGWNSSWPSQLSQPFYNIVLIKHVAWYSHFVRKTAPRLFMNQLQQSPMLLERMSFAILDITNAWFLQPTFQWFDCTKNIWVAGSPTNVGACLESWHSLHHVWHCPMLQYHHLLATQRRHHHLIVSAAHAASDPGLCCYCLGTRKI